MHFHFIAEEYSTPDFFFFLCNTGTVAKHTMKTALNDFYLLIGNNLSGSEGDENRCCTMINLGFNLDVPFHPKLPLSSKGERTT